MLSRIRSSISPEKISRAPSSSRILWPKNSHADTLPRDLLGSFYDHFKNKIKTITVIAWNDKYFAEYWLLLACEIQRFQNENSGSFEILFMSKRTGRLTSSLFSSILLCLSTTIIDLKSKIRIIQRFLPSFLPCIFSIEFHCTRKTFHNCC